VSVAPDFVEPFVGWRVWVVCEECDTFRLRSVVYDTTWLPRQELVADCLRSPSLLRRRCRAPHEPPFDRCQCGIYGASEPQILAHYLDGYHRFELGVFPRVFGLVSLWGTVIACERGWRASHAYPACLYVPACAIGGHRVRVEEVALGLSDYGVPIEIVECETRHAPGWAMAGAKGNSSRG
jgi:hypothetical protein